MDFRISGLLAEPFIPFFGMTDAELRDHGAMRVLAKVEDGPLVHPCRVSLRDAKPGDTSILLTHCHHATVTSPYRASGPIFVRQGATVPLSVVNDVPAQQRSRLLSIRAYDTGGIMVDADVTEGSELEAVIDRMFRYDAVAFLHAHYAKRDCYACRIDRA